MRQIIAIAALMLLAASWSSPGGARTLNGFDLSGALVPERAIERGGPPRDGIPALTDPKLEPAADARWLDPDDRVLGIALHDEARAYPVRILDWHEIVNDSIGEQHFAITWCPLCGSGVVFATNAGEGALNFGVSGLLYNSDVLMFDRQSGSLWSQLLGKAVAGPLKGTPLPRIPVEHTTWQEWQARHPGTRVLSRDTGFARDYRRSPYAGYDRSRELYFKVERESRDRHPKALVLGIEIGGDSRAWPFAELERHGRDRFTDTVGDRTVVVRWNAAASSARLEAPDGTPLPATVSFWFAWYAFHPDTTVFAASP